jgi:tetratricopeptide (TPR) repeat protein
MLKKEKDHYSFTQILNYITSNWAVCLSVVSFFALLSGCLVYGISPLYTLKQVGYQQQQEYLKKDFVTFHNDLGIQFLFIEQIDAAKDEFEQVLKVDPLNQNATRGLFECDVFQEANKTNTKYNPVILYMKLKGILKERPDDPLPYLYLGDFYRVHNSLTSAADCYNKSISLDTSVAAAYAGLGHIYSTKHNLDSAITMDLRAVNLSPWNEQYRNNLAAAYDNKKEYQNANSVYVTTLRLNPDYLFPYCGYSNFLRLSSNLKDALNYQEKFVGLLNDDNITNQIANHNEIWHLPIKSGKIINVYDIKMKKLLAYYDIALTYYLLGDETKTLEYLKKANDLNIDEKSKTSIKSIFDLDIENLERQPNFINKTTDFTNRFQL